MKLTKARTLLISSFLILLGHSLALGDWVGVLYKTQVPGEGDSIRLFRSNGKSIVVCGPTGENRVEYSINSLAMDEFFANLKAACLASDVPIVPNIESNGPYELGVLEMQSGGQLLRGEWKAGHIPLNIEKVINEIIAVERARQNKP